MVRHAAAAAHGTLVFSHANSFPAGVYEPLFAHWRRAGWRVQAVEKFGHDPRHPVTNGWPRLSAQLAEFVQAVSPGRPVALVGHSLGGLLSLMVACRHPEVASAVVMLDSPLIAGWRASALQIGKLAGLAERLGPGHIAARRREHWPDLEAVHKHFAGKRAFARWAPEVLEAYVRCGFEPAPQGGVRLAFRRDVERRIYNALPHHLERLLARHPPRCPVHFVAGTRSAEMRQAGSRASQRLAAGRWRWIEGSHLFPMEQPQATAQAVLAALEDSPEPAAG
jgi:pimeloyl-ACP methyl ester carboxylesterase